MIYITIGKDSMITQARELGADVRKYEREREERAFRRLFAPPNRRGYGHEHPLNERSRKAHS